MVKKRPPAVLEVDLTTGAKIARERTEKKRHRQSSRCPSVKQKRFRGSRFTFFDGPFLLLEVASEIHHCYVCRTWYCLKLIWPECYFWWVVFVQCWWALLINCGVQLLPSYHVLFEHGFYFPDNTNKRGVVKLFCSLSIFWLHSVLESTTMSLSAILPETNNYTSENQWLNDRIFFRGSSYFQGPDHLRFGWETTWKLN